MVNKTYYTYTPIHGEYDLISHFQEGLALVWHSLEESKYGFIDKTGNVAIQIKLSNGFSATTPIRVYPEFNEGLSPIFDGEQCGFMDKTGAIVIPPEYEAVSRFSEGLAAVQKSGKWGFINKNGETVISFMYEWAQWGFTEGLALVKKDGKSEFINKMGETVISYGLEYDQIDRFSEGLARVMTGKGEEVRLERLANESDADYNQRCLTLHEINSKNERWGFIDKTGKLVIPCVYTDAMSFRNGLAIVSVTPWRSRKCRYIDRTGKTILETDYLTVSYFHYGLAMAQKENGKRGFIDQLGNVVIPFIYDWALDFSSGLAAVGVWDANECRKGYIDKTGHVVVPLEYEIASNIFGGLAVVRKNGEWGILEFESYGEFSG